MAMRERSLIFMLLLCLVGNVFALEYNIDWQASEPTDYLWSTGANWEGYQVPNSTQTARLMKPWREYCLIDSNVVADVNYLKAGWGDKNRGYSYDFRITGGSLTVRNNFSTGGGDENVAPIVISMSAGDVNIGTYLRIAEEPNAVVTFNMTGGTIITNGATDDGYGLEIMADPNGDGVGMFNLHGGTVTLKNGGVLKIRDGGVMDMSEGTLIMDGNQTSLVADYNSLGRITVPEGGGIPPLYVKALYEAGPNTTTITVSSEYAHFPHPLVKASEDTNLTPILSWTAGDHALSHNVYFGTDYDEIHDANDPNTLPGRGNQLGTTYVPGNLDLGTRYYWRIDEVVDGYVIKGRTWDFDTQNAIVIDDFENYDSTAELVAKWVGSDVTLQDTLFYEEGKSMKFTFDNAGSSDFTEVVRTFSSPNDFSQGNAQALVLNIHGDEMNTSANLGNVQMYLILEDADTNSSEVTYTSLADTNQEAWEGWMTWNIDLDDFSADGVDLSQVSKIVIGFRHEGEGIIYFDNIGLYNSRCIGEYSPEGDFAVGDCTVDDEELSQMADEWLYSGYTIQAVSAPNTAAGGLIVWYKFDESSGYDVEDSSGNNYDGISRDEYDWGEVPDWYPAGGKFGGCIGFTPGCGYGVQVPDSALNEISDEITISIWLFGDASNTPVDDEDGARIFYGVGWENDEEYERRVAAMVPNDDGRPCWDAGNRGYDPKDEQYWRYPTPSKPEDWRGQWNHYAFVKDVNNGIMQMYHNGALVSETTGVFQPIDGMYHEGDVAGFAIGSHAKCSKSYYNGWIDDFRMYDHVLSHAEIVDLADKTQITQPLKFLTTTDISGDNKVNFVDFAVMADDWLDEMLWP